MTPEEFRAAGHELVDWIARYWERLEGADVRGWEGRGGGAGVSPGEIIAGLPAEAPEEGEAWPELMADVERLVMPGVVHWQSPRFFGYFPCNASGPGVLGELLSAGLNLNGMVWASSPAVTELEQRMVVWAGKLIGLPAKFLGEPGGAGGGVGGGVVQGTASEAVVCALAAARQRVRRAHGPEADQRMTVYASTQAHSSVVKAAMITGLARAADDRARVRLIGVDAAHAMRADELGRAMRGDRAAGLIPGMVVATIGTTSSLAVDPLAEIARACAESAGPGTSEVKEAAGGKRLRGEGGVWIHVDAAMAGSACVCPEFRGLLAGVEHAHSFNFNPHKWLLTNFDCSCFYLARADELIDAMSITPEYLRTAPARPAGGAIAGAGRGGGSGNGGAGGGGGGGAPVDYRDWQIALGRRFRALKMWFVMRSYGVKGLREHIRRGVEQAAAFESWVRDDARFELECERRLSLVCFRLRDDDAGGARTRALLERVNATGRVFLSHTALPAAQGPDRYVIRMAIGATLTRERHVREAWEILAREAGNG